MFIYVRNPRKLGSNVIKDDSSHNQQEVKAKRKSKNLSFRACFYLDECLKVLPAFGRSFLLQFNPLRKTTHQHVPRLN